MLVVTFELC